MIRNIQIAAAIIAGVAISISCSEKEKADAASASAPKPLPTQKSAPAIRPLPEDFVEHLAGTLPIVVTVTHDGEKTTDAFPAREDDGSAERFSRAQDKYAWDFAKDLANAMVQKTGKRPHLLYDALQRRFVDVNRSSESAYQHPFGKKVYDAFHGKLKSIVQEIRKTHEHGLLLDIHGQTEFPADIYLITHEGRTLTDLRKRFGDQVLNGQISFGAQLKKKDYAVPPFSKQIVTDWLGQKPEGKETVVKLSPDIPFEKPYGFLVDEYGSHRENGIDAMELEIHRRIRYTKEKRRELAETVAGIALQWNERFFKPVQPAAASNP